MTLILIYINRRRAKNCSPFLFCKGEKVVLEILKANEEARNDDMKLYLLVCEAVNPYPTCDRDIGSFSFSSVMNRYRELRLPHFESVRRSRAKIQAEIPELAGD